MSVEKAGGTAGDDVEKSHSSAESANEREKEQLEFLKRNQVEEFNRSRVEGDRPLFDHKNLRWARFPGIDFSGVSLPNCDLREADLTGANCRGADFQWANLSKVNFSGADLSGADLEETNLYEADLRGANLAGAKLIGARYALATMSREQLRLFEQAQQVNLID